MRAFQGGTDLEKYLFHSRRILRALGRAVATRLHGAGIFVPMPEGAFYLFPDFGGRAEALAARGITTSAALCERHPRGDRSRLPAREWSSAATRRS